jgi:hypothetical protein
MEAKERGSSRAIHTGLALAVTVGIGYAPCALAFRIWPEGAMSFMNSLFHGLDFSKLRGGAALFDFGTFFFALAVSMVWAFLLGTLFGWIVDRLHPALK